MIENCDPLRIRTAGYDLRLGSEYYLTEPDSLRSTQRRFEPTIRNITNTADTLTIPPNEVVIATVMERLSLPLEVVGHLSLKLEVLLEGVIMGSQSQIDAGYEGEIFALLYNLSDQPVYLKSGDPILRLEFRHLDVPTTLPYAGDFANKALADVIERPVRSSLASMQRDVSHGRDETEKAMRGIYRTRSWLSIGGLIATVIAVLAIWFTALEPQRTLDERVDSLETKAILLEEKAISDLQMMIVDLREAVDDLERRLDNVTPEEGG